MISEGKRLQKQLAQYLREKDASDLRLLRARIASAKVARAALLRGARSQCRSARAALVIQQRAEREAFVTRQRGARIVERTTCGTGKAEARASGGHEIAISAAALADAKRLKRVVDHAYDQRDKKRSTKRERSAEDDDAVRSNLPPELVPVFDRVSRKIKAGPRRTRTEAFLEWAEENPDEIIAVQQADADAAVKKLVAEQRELSRDVRSARRYKQTPAELEALLAAVPF